MSRENDGRWKVVGGRIEDKERKKESEWNVERMGGWKEEKMKEIRNVK